MSAELPTDAEALYLRLVQGGSPGAHDQSPLATLERLRLVRRDPDGSIVVRPPRSALAAVAARHEVEALRARESAETLAAAYAGRTTNPGGFVEVLHSGEQVQSAFETMQGQAKTEIRALDRGSYLSAEEQSPAQTPALARGVGYRVVYDASVLQTDAGLAAVQASISDGEVARVFPGVPLKLVIADADQALIAVPTVGGQDVIALLVHQSVLLTAQIELFEAFWRMAVPVGPLGPDGTGTAEEPTVGTRRLLALLSAGLTDGQIARDLGVSERTVYRRISRLHQLLGAQTRFQLGVQASRRGWL